MSSLTVEDKQIAYAFLLHLENLKSTGAIDDSSACDTIKVINNAFGISNDSTEDFKEFSFYPITISQLISAGISSTKALTFNEIAKIADDNSQFDAFHSAVTEKGFYEGTEPGSMEYLKRHAKLLQKFSERVPTTQTSVKGASSNEDLAEEKKILGNTAINNKDYHGAIQYYTEALDLSKTGPNSHIYYCNRAAAYCHLEEYSEAVADCESAVALVPDYVKAYSRLGLSNFFLERYEASVNAYERAVELEPDNEGSKKSLQQARKKCEQLRKSSLSSSSGSKGASSSGGMPDISAMLKDPTLGGLANNPMMKDAMNKVGGQEGLAKLMQDPEMMAMAQKMMSNPAALQQAMSMFGGAGGAGGGGMPDMSALAGMMGGLGGGNTKSKGPFKGFEE